MAPGKIRERPFGYEFGAPIRIDWVDWGIFVNRNRLWVTITGSTGGENKTPNPSLVTAFAELK